MLRTNLDRTINGGVFLTLALCCTFSVLAVDTPEYWATANKDGHWRNANDRAVQGNLRLRWTRSLNNFYVMSASAQGRPSNPKWGQRSNTLSIRDGRILCMVPSSTPETCWDPRHFATFGIFAMSNGVLLNSAISPHRGEGTTEGMDSDTYEGVINQYWQRDGMVYTAHGSDVNFYASFDPYTGEHPFGKPDVALTGLLSANSSGYFAMTDSNPQIFARGGASGHLYYETGYGGLIGFTNPTQLNSMKMYNSFVVDQDFIYPLCLTNTTAGTGMQIQGVQFSATPSYSATVRWTYADAKKSILTRGQDHCMGAQRAYLLGEDSRLYYYGYNTDASFNADFSQGVFLVGVPTAGTGTTRTADINVPITNYNPVAESGHTAAELQYALAPQIASRGKYVVVFQPEQSSLAIKGHLFCFDTTTKSLAWRKDFPAGYFSTQVSVLTWPCEQAVHLVIAGDQAYVVEPLGASGNLSLKVQRFNLADGSQTTSTFSPLDQNGVPVPVGTGLPALRAVAAVDSTLTCLIDCGLTTQALVVIEGDANPTYTLSPIAVISAPMTGDTNLKTISDFPTAPTNQIDSGVAIAFSSQGSFSPQGGALTYVWNFGDGSTSALANPTHTYASGGLAPNVTNRTVSLTVKDSAGNASAAVTRLLAIRDVGSVQEIALSAVADSYVDGQSANVSKNYGTQGLMLVNAKLTQRGYVRFDVTGVDVTKIVSATLRLCRQPMTPYQLDGSTNLLVRQCSNVWDELTITSANAPVPGDGVGEYSLLAHSWTYSIFRENLDIPVTQYVKTTGPDGLVSFELELTNVAVNGVSNYLQLFTKESAYPPQLLLDVGSPGYAAPTITQQPASITLTDVFSTPLSIAATSPLGESKLSYNWEMVSGPQRVTFAPNDTNAAKATTVSAAINVATVYTLRCVVSDGLQSVTSQSVTLTINVTNLPPTVQTPAKATPSPVTGTTTNLTVLGADDQGESNLTYTWATTGTPPATVTFSANGTNAAKSSTATFHAAGSYSFVVTIADAGGKSVTSSVSVVVNQTATSSPSLNPTPVSVATGGSQYFHFMAVDQFGTTFFPSAGVTWTVTGGGTISNAGSYWCTFTAGATPGGPFTLKAVDGTLSATASITVTSSGNQPPTVTAATATPNPVTGNTSNLSATATDDGGEPALTYTWSTVSAPSGGTVTYSSNGTNAAKASTATFNKAGAYSLKVTATDSGGLTGSMNVAVTVNQTLTSITVTPSTATVSAGGTQTFTAAGKDQFGAAMTPAVTWTVTGTGNSISSAGLFTAGTTAGTYTVTATSGTLKGTASVTVTVIANQPPVITSGPTASPNPATVGQTVTFTTAASDADGDALTYAWTFGDGSTASGASTTHAYSVAGTFTAGVSVSDGHGHSVTGSTTVTVSSSGTPTTVVLQDGLNGYAGTQDTYLDGAGPNISYGSKTVMYTSVSNGVLRPLVRFAIFQSEGGPVPNGAAIQSATLSLYRTTIYNDTYTLNRVLKNWNEAEATWNHANAATSWTTPGAGGSGTDIATTADSTLTTTGWTAGWVNLNATTGVAAFSSGTPNYGWRLLDNLLYNLNTYCTREYATDATLRPKLTIVYQVAAAPALAAEVTAPVQSLTISRIKGAVSFTAGGHDGCAILGVIPNLPASDISAGQVLVLNMNGAEVTFTLDAKGRGKSAQGTIVLKRKPDGSAVFAAKIQKGTWAGVWGLNSSASTAEPAMPFPVVIELGGNSFAGSATASLTQKANVGAQFKK